MSGLGKIISGLLKEQVEKLDAGTTELTEEEALEILEILGTERMSKEQATLFLGVSRSKFDQMVREGKIPEGRKIKGFTEKTWKKSDLIKVKL